MKNSILLVLALCFYPVLSVADATDTHIDKFVSEYSQAYRKNDITGLRSLIHPKSLACIDKVSSDYFKQELSLSSGDSSTPATWKQVDISTLQTTPGFERLPASPEKGIKVTWQEGTAASVKEVTHMVLLAQDKGNYVAVLACLTPEQIQKRNAFFTKQKTEK